MIDYEWVVERLEPDCDDIAECSYWPEDECDNALAIMADWEKSGHRVDFGICRFVSDPEEGVQDRQYGYVERGKTLPKVLEYGAALPFRFHKFVRPV